MDWLTLALLVFWAFATFYLHAWGVLLSVLLPLALLMFISDKIRSYGERSHHGRRRPTN